MSDIDQADVIHSRIWAEEAEPDNPFAARASYCRGYDVFGEMVGNARWIEMLVLLFRDELPGGAGLDMLEALAVALANPGPRDPSVHAAMCGGVGRSAAAASLMAALAVGAGRNGGAREVFDAMTVWHACGTVLSSWPARAKELPDAMEMWPGREHLPGFDPNGVSTPTVVRQLLETLSRIGGTPRLAWLDENWRGLTEHVGMPLAMSGVTAAALADLEFTPEEGEMLYLLLRLPGAAAHALEQSKHGYRRFPFYPVELEDDPRKESVA
jgi:citrate synthase